MYCDAMPCHRIDGNGNVGKGIDRILSLISNNFVTDKYKTNHKKKQTQNHAQESVQN